MGSTWAATGGDHHHPRRRSTPASLTRSRGLNRIPILMLGPLLHRPARRSSRWSAATPSGVPGRLPPRRAEALGAEIDTGRRDRRQGRQAARCASSFRTRASARPRPCCCRRAGRGPDGAPQRGDRAGGRRAGAVPAADGCTSSSARPPNRHRGRGESPGCATRLQGDRIEAFSYLVAGPDHPGRGAGHGCPQDRLVTAITTLARMGARFESPTSGSPRRPRTGCGPRPSNRHPPRIHDRLAAAPDGAVHPGRRDVGAARDGLREPPVYVPALQKMGCEIEVFSACLGGPACRFHDGNSAHSAVIRGVSKLQGAEVNAAGRAGRVLRRPRRLGRRQPVHPARRAPHRARLPPPVRAVRLARPPPRPVDS